MQTFVVCAQSSAALLQDADARHKQRVSVRTLVCQHRLWSDCQERCSMYITVSKL